ncbi:MAG: DNA polymerase I [Clostridiales bacterium]|nr:DNA polymerase I [Clostridiales bacterium]
MSDAKRLLLVDGNSIINRSYYATAGRNNLTAPDGTPTGAVNIYLNTLAKYMEEVDPTHTCTLFDLKAPTFRHQAYAEYKGTRKGMPEDLAAQMPVLKEVLDAMGFPRYEQAGLEADDLIGTLKTMGVNAGFEVYILSGDKDDFQLIDEHTKIIMPVTKKDGSGTEYYDEALFQERYGIPSRDFVTAKALMGDSSDNIPGVKGIGEKGAMDLVRKYITLDGLYEHLDELSPKLREKLETDKENAYMSLMLSKIVTDAEISITLDELERKPIDSASAAACFYKYGFRSQMKKWNIDETAVGGAVPVVEESAEEKNYPKLSGQRPMIILDQDVLRAINEILPKIKDTDPVAIDMKEIKGKPVLGLSVAPDQVYVWTGIPDIRDVLGSLVGSGVGNKRENAPVLYSAKNHFKLIEDGFPFDMVFDVEIAGYVLNHIEGTDPSFEMLVEHSSRKPFPILPGYGEVKEEGKSKGRQQDLFALIDGISETEQPLTEEDVLDFSYRVLLIRWISYYQKEEIDKTSIGKLIYEIEMPLVRVLDRMERRGVLVDVAQIDELHREFDAKVRELESEIYSMAEEEFTILSPKQLGKILFEKLGLPSGKKLASGGYSTNSEELEKIRDKHPIVDKILEYRQIQKLDSTFVMGLKKSISEKDGRVHTTFSQAMTNTGRLSSSDPNLQNIPIRTDLGSLIRKTFVAKEGYVLIDADYSQIELRLLAAISHDEEMISSFLEGKDIHTKTACGIFGLPPEMIDPGMRAAAKRVNFSIVYGVSDYGLSQDLGVSIYEAHRYIEEYYRQFPTIKACLEGFKKEGHEKGYVSTLFGRRRILKELTSANYNIRSFGERAAMNTPIQGTAADIIKLAMNHVETALSEAGLDAHLILQVHDELIVEAREDIAKQAAKILQDTMENVVKLDVPLLAEASIGRTWAEAH